MNISIFLIKLIFIMFLVWVSIHDIKYHRIENYTPLIIIFFSFFINQINPIPISNKLIGLLICFIPFFIINIISNDGIGMGDVKLLGAFGFMFGFYFGIWFSLLGLFLSMIGMIIYRIIKKNKEAVPMAPFLCLSATFFLIIN